MIVIIIINAFLEEENDSTPQEQNSNLSNAPVIIQGINTLFKLAKIRL